jgi:hypothetical protein
MVHTDNENHIFTNTTTSKTSFVIKGLIPNAIFEWFVAPIYEDGTNGIRNGLQFSTPKTKAPALSSPGKNSKQTKSSPIKFSWSKPAGLPSSGYQYILQYGSDINFSSGTFVQLDELVKTSISLPIAKNTIPQQIYWRVKVMNVNGMDDFSDFSAPRLFYR